MAQDNSSVPIFRFDVVSHVLWLLITVVVVAVAIIRRSDVVHLVYTTALIASLVWTIP